MHGGQGAQERWQQGDRYPSGQGPLACSSCPLEKQLADFIGLRPTSLRSVSTQKGILGKMLFFFLGLQYSIRPCHMEPIFPDTN